MKGRVLPFYMRERMTGSPLTAQDGSSHACPGCAQEAAVLVRLLDYAEFEAYIPKKLVSSRLKQTTKSH